MSTKALFSSGDVVEPIIAWLNVNAQGLFAVISVLVEMSLSAMEAFLSPFRLSS
jgi:ABC-type proline/glycine betaine transport system permease subunit